MVVAAVADQVVVVLLGPARMKFIIHLLSFVRACVVVTRVDWRSGAGAVSLRCRPVPGPAGRRRSWSCRSSRYGKWPWGLRLRA